MKPLKQQSSVTNVFLIFSIVIPGIYLLSGLFFIIYLLFDGANLLGDLLTSFFMNIFMGGTTFGFLLFLGGLIFSIIITSKNKQNKLSNKLAITALIINSLAILTTIVGFVVLVIAGLSIG